VGAKKSFALSDTYGVANSNGSADASNIVSKLGYLFFLYIEVCRRAMR
jgi:hypothetical protein